MEIAIRRSRASAPAESDGFRRAMGTWRSSREMEKLHAPVRRRLQGPERPGRRAGRGAVPAGRGLRELRLQQEPRGGVRADRVRVGVPEALLPGAVHGGPRQRPADGLLPGRGARSTTPSATASRSCRWTSTASRFRTTTEWVGMPGEPLPEGCGIERRPPVVRSSGCVVPDRRTRRQLAAGSAEGLRGPARASTWSRGSARSRRTCSTRELERGPYRSLADVVARTGAGRRGDRATDPGRCASTRWAGPDASCCGSCARWRPRRAGRRRVPGRRRACDDDGCDDDGPDEDELDEDGCPRANGPNVDGWPNAGWTHACGWNAGWPRVRGRYAARQRSRGLDAARRRAGELRTRKPVTRGPCTSPPWAARLRARFDQPLPRARLDRRRTRVRSGRLFARSGRLFARSGRLFARSGRLTALARTQSCRTLPCRNVCRIRRRHGRSLGSPGSVTPHLRARTGHEEEQL